MELELVTAVRNPFYVLAVQVTGENMELVRDWCSGTIYTVPEKEVAFPNEKPRRFIKVKVEAAKSERQTKAYVGDWVLKAGEGFKVYTNKAYMGGFIQLMDTPCGDDTMTADRKPCVLAKGHKNAARPVGCRSFEDYKVFGPRPPLERIDWERVELSLDPKSNLGNIEVLDGPRRDEACA